MKILVIGSGGREHALIWKLKKDNDVEVFCAPGNAGIGQIATNIDIKVEDIEKLIDFAKNEEIDLTIVGPEVPLAMGIVDEFEKMGLRIFGTNKSASELEKSKDFSKAFMVRNNIPTARYESYTDSKKAIASLEHFNYPVVIKADGLCYGKGVVICHDREMAVETIEDILEGNSFGSEGSKIVIEEFLDGIEVSLICLVSKGKIYPLETAEDYKQIYDGDKGPNTGGVGCYSPSSLLNKDLYKKVEDEILENIESGFKKDEIDFTGILFIGLMVVKDMPYVLEFNTRFGDPETQVLMKRLDSNLLDLFNKTLDSTITKADIKWDEKPSMTVILTSGGYPGSYVNGYEIKGLDKVGQDITVFHNGTKEEASKMLTNGGRVLSITTTGKDMNSIRDKIYGEIEKIEFKDMYYRKDIGENIEY